MEQNKSIGVPEDTTNRHRLRKTRTNSDVDSSACVDSLNARPGAIAISTNNNFDNNTIDGMTSIATTTTPRIIEATVVDINQEQMWQQRVQELEEQLQIQQQISKNNTATVFGENVTTTIQESNDSNDRNRLPEKVNKQQNNKYTKEWIIIVLAVVIVIATVAYALTHIDN